MNMWMIGVAAMALGIDYSWQPLPEGGVEYIIQLDQQTLELLRAGETVESHIPPAAGNVRSYRIIAGSQKLPPPRSAIEIAPKLPPRQSPPRALPSDTVGKPIVERSAAHVEPLNPTAEAKSLPKTASESPPETPAKPWLPLTFTLFGLFASIGANVFLGWIAWDSRRQLGLKNV